MDFSQMLQSLQSTLGPRVLDILAAVVILIIGWFAALLVQAAVGKGLKTLGLNARVNSATDGGPNLERGIAKGAFWTVLLVALIAVFNKLNLPQVSEPLDALVSQVFAYLPRLGAGAFLSVLAWALAAGVQKLVNKGLSATTLDERLQVGAGMAPASQNIGNVLFWLIILLFLPAILGAFQLEGLLSPVQGMVDEVLAMLPNIFAGAVIGIVGWFVAKILSNLVSNLLGATGVDKFGAQHGLTGTMSASKLVGTLVFVFVFVPALIAALNALQIQSISGPATDMLGIIMSAIPKVFAAIVILMLTYMVARFASSLVSNLLGGVGANNLPQKLGLAHVFSDGWQPSVIAGRLVMFFAMLFAAVEAANLLDFEQVSNIVTMFIQFGGQILLGSVILAVGVWLANLAHAAIERMSSGSALAGLARIAILGLVSAMGLRAMGIADDIVNLAFGLTLGAIAVAVALSFGLGGREAAGRQMEYWLAKLRS